MAAEGAPVSLAAAPPHAAARLPVLINTLLTLAFNVGLPVFPSGHRFPAAHGNAAS